MVQSNMDTSLNNNCSRVNIPTKNMSVNMLP